MQRRPMGRRNLSEKNFEDDVIIFVRKKKGNREGITVRMQIFTPSAAPSIAALLSNMSSNIPIADSIAVYIAF